ncbi:hypothetical protein RhiirB3_449318, partial [Rhizophagus irregularis]
IGIDQLNQIEGLQTLLGESLNRTNTLNQDLIRVRDDFTYERNARRHWETIVQQNQACIAGIQIANLALQNNPPNIAIIQDVMHTISPGLAQLPFYDG